MSTDRGDLDEELRTFSRLLRQLHREAGGPSVGSLDRNPAFPLRRSRIYEILNGETKDPPSYDFVLSFVAACVANAERKGRRLTVRVDAEWWRQRHDRLVTVAEETRVGRPDRDRPDPPGSGATRPAPRELPADRAGLVGREAELAELDLQHPHGTLALPIVALVGPAGVGKTALAVHWAHRVAARFPDGQVFVDLRGYDPGQPADPDEVLAGVLRRLGVAGTAISLDPAERVAQYRTLVAGRRLLLLLDNARDADHVRPLLPGAASCAVIVTSRTSLAGLVAREGAHRIAVAPLDAASSSALLRSMVGDRVDADTGSTAAIAAIAEHCARLPLALRVAGEFAAARPGLPLDKLVLDLADERQRLDLLDADLDPRTAARAVLSWSVKHLPAPAAQLFALLGLHPPHGISAASVAALAGVGPVRARHQMDLLVDAGLLTDVAGARVAMHDLLRVYASELLRTLTGEPARLGAVDRLLGYFLTAAGTAMNVLYPWEAERRPPLAAAPEVEFDSAEAAAGWLASEQDNLLFLIHQAAGAERHDEVLRLVTTLWRHLDTGAHYAELAVIQRYAVTAGQAVGDRAAVGAALTNLGLIDWRQGRWSQAIERMTQAYDVHQELGDRARASSALNILGLTYARLGRLDDAARQYEAAGALSREAGDRRGQANALHNLGQVHLSGDYDRAVAALRPALEIYDSLGEGLGAGRTRHLLGFAALRRGDYEEAEAQLDQALSILEDIGDRNGVAGASNDLGYLYCRQGRFDEAASRLTMVLDTFRAIGDPSGEANTLDKLGFLHVQTGDHDRARDFLDRALRQAAEGGLRAVEASARNGLGELCRARGRFAEAIGEHGRAAALAREAGDRYEEARALEGEGRAQLESAGRDEADDALRRALDLYARLGVPEADPLRRLLA